MRPTYDPGIGWPGRLLGLAVVLALWLLLRLAG